MPPRAPGPGECRATDRRGAAMSLPDSCAKSQRAGSQENQDVNAARSCVDRSPRITGEEGSPTGRTSKEERAFLRDDFDDLDACLLWCFCFFGIRPARAAPAPQQDECACGHAQKAASTGRRACTQVLICMHALMNRLHERAPARMHCAKWPQACRAGARLQRRRSARSHLHACGRPLYVCAVNSRRTRA